LGRRKQASSWAREWLNEDRGTGGRRGRARLRALSRARGSLAVGAGSFGRAGSARLADRARGTAHRSLLERAAQRRHGTLWIARCPRWSRPRGLAADALRGVDERRVLSRELGE